VLQVREKEDRHQQQKISGFLCPNEEIQAAREAVAAADMEVYHPTYMTWHPPTILAVSSG